MSARQQPSQPGSARQQPGQRIEYGRDNDPTNPTTNSYFSYYYSNK